MHLVFPKNQPNLQRGVEKNCQTCTKKFSVLVREHQCKRCLKAVCSDCGNYKSFTFSSTSLEKQLHRICKSCKDSSDYITSLIKNNNLKFAEMSDIGKDWIKRIIKKPPTFGTDTSQHKIFTREVYSQLWASYSFQLRELVGLLTSEYQQSSLYDVVCNVYKTVISVAQGTSISKVMHLIIYVLCFCSPDKAVLLILYLLQIKKQHKDLRTVAFKFVKALPYQKQYQKIENYMYYRFDKYIDSLFVNGSSIECSVFYMGQVLKKKNLQDLLMFFSSHLFINRETLYLRAVQNSRDLIDLMVVRHCSLLQIMSNFKQIKNKNIVIYNEENSLSQKLKKPQNLNKSSGDGERSSQQQANSSFQSAKPQFIKRQAPSHNKNRLLDDSILQPEKDQPQNKRNSQDPIKNRGSQDSTHQKVATESIGVFRKNSNCSRCEYLQQQSQKLKQITHQLQSQKIQLKTIASFLEAEVAKLKKQIKQFDTTMVQLINDKNGFHKQLQQTKKQLKQAMSVSVNSFGDSQIYKKKLETAEKQLQAELNRQKDLTNIIEGKDTTINQQIMNLEESSKTIKKLIAQNQMLKQDKDNLNNINTALKSQKSQLQTKVFEHSSSLALLEKQYSQKVNQNKALRLQTEQYLAQISKLQQLNTKQNDRIRMMEQKMKSLSEENSKWNKEVNQLQTNIISLEQQVKILSSQSSDRMAQELLDQARKEYEQKLQKHIQSNNTLQHKIDQLEKVFSEKQQTIVRLQNLNITLKKQIEQKVKTISQQEMQIKVLQIEKNDAKSAQNEVMSKYYALKLETESKDRNLETKNIQIAQLKSQLTQKNSQLQNHYSKIQFYQRTIAQLKAQIDNAKQNKLSSSKRQASNQQISNDNNAALTQQLTQTTKNNKYLSARCEQLQKQLSQMTAQVQKVKIKSMTLQQQFRHTKVQLQKANKQNNELKSALKLAEKLLSEKKDEIRAMGISGQRSSGIGQNLAFDKLKEVQAKNEALKGSLNQAQKHSKGLMDKMNQLSALMMQLQGQKLELADQNFYLKQMLNEHKIKF